MIIALSLLLSFFARAEVVPSTVREIISSSEILIATTKDTPCLIDDTFAIYAKDNPDEVVAYAEIKSVTKVAKSCIAKTVAHSKSGLIRRGDYARRLDLTQYNENLPGRYDLIQEGKKSYSARYKPLVFTGFLQGFTAATLDKNEFLFGFSAVTSGNKKILFGVSKFAYGITDRLQVLTSPILVIDKALDVGVNYKAWQGEDFRVTPAISAISDWKTGDQTWNFDLAYDSHSNSRSMTHTKFSYTWLRPRKLLFYNKNIKRQFATLSSVQEWMLPSWHRILLGPKVISGEEVDIGFTLSFVFVFNSLHATVNLITDSVTKLDIKNNAQRMAFDVFWRF